LNGIIRNPSGGLALARDLSNMCVWFFYRGQCTRFARFAIQVTLKTAVHESILKHGIQNKASKAKRTRVWIFYPFIAEEQNCTMSAIPFIKIILLLAFNKTKRGDIAKISR